MSATLKSKGPNGRPEAVGDDIADPAFQINESEVTPSAMVQGNLNFVFNNSTAVPVTPVYSALITAAYAGGSGTSGCISLNIGQINDGESKPLTQHFSSAFPAKLPVGKSVLRPALHLNNSCSGSGIQSANDMAVFIPDGLNVLSVNLPTINYTVTQP